MEHGLQSEWASVVAAHRLSSCGSWALEHRLNSCGAEAQSLYGMWDLPGWGTELVSPALAGNSLPLSHQGSAKMVFFFFSISVAFHCWFLLQAGSLHLNHREAHYKARTPQFFKWFYGNRCVTDFLNRVNFLRANFRITAELSTDSSHIPPGPHHAVSPLSTSITRVTCLLQSMTCHDFP